MAVIKLQSKTAKDRKPVEREPFIEIDGVLYEVDKTFTAAFALEFVDKSSNEGIDAANVWLMRRALGEKCYQAILGFADLEPEDLAGIVKALLDKVTRAMEPGKGRRSNG